LLAAGLSGCGGGGSSSAPAAAAGGGGGAATSDATVGAAATQAAAASPGTTNTANNPNQAFSLIQAAGGNVVTVNSPPQLKFTVVDSDGMPVTGLALVSTTAGANLDNCGTGTGALRYARNVRAAIAKFIPGTIDPLSGQKIPDQWQNLIYSTSTGAGNGGSVNAPLVRATTDPTPSTTNNAPGSTLTYDSGVYTYKFSTDVTNASYNTGAIKTDGTANAGQWSSTLDATGATVAAAAASGGVLTNGHVLTKDGSTTYRVALQLCYMDKGTRVYANPTYDFTVSADGKSTPVTDTSKTRQMVDKASCNGCHNPITAHGSRVEPAYCVMCHNVDTQDKTASPTAGAPANTSVDFKLMIHKIHMGEHLMNGFKVGTSDFTDVKFPQDVRNCTKCHDGSANATHKTPQGDNWKNIPSRNACGACHDGINFTTGGGMNLAGTYAGHIGGAQSDDTKCALCHNAANIPIYHIPVTPPNKYNSFDWIPTAQDTTAANANSNAASIASNSDNLPTGAIKVSYDIKSVSRNASKQPVIVFRMLQNGAVTAFNTFGAKTDLWDNFIGSPSAYFVFSVPQDGIATPADFNALASGYIKNIWNGSATGTGAGTLSAPDADGYYTLTLTGVAVPDNAVMLTGGLGYTYSLSSTQPLTQTNVAGYLIRACGVAANGNKCGGLIVPAPDATMVATGYTGRHAIVDNAKCNLCHEKLGEFTDESFHAGQRNDGPTCSWCHNPNRTSSGWSADSTYFVHSIHGASKRTVAFNWHATSSLDNFSNVGYPGKLSDCRTCHVDGAYDFSAAASAAALPNRLYRYVATGTLTASVSTSPYVAGTVTGFTSVLGTPLGSGFSFNAATASQVSTAAAGTTLVDSPIAAVCSSCHDGQMTATPGTSVKDHIEQMGLGSIYQPRTAALAKTEQCMLCHSPTSKIAPIKAMHGL
jgi:OmcA/MtrC family decaheme c-type cytochrome